MGNLVTRVALVLGLMLGGSQAMAAETDLLTPVWSTSWQQYGQPHAIWLAQDKTPGANLGILTVALGYARKHRQAVELVVYAIPYRDMGQSSAGGFSTPQAYWEDNLLTARQIKAYVDETGLPVRVYLEPDALAHAVQVRMEAHGGEVRDVLQKDRIEPEALYQERTRILSSLVTLYHRAGAEVYLDAGHGGWFSTEESQAKLIEALNASNTKEATGVVVNVSNRQPVETERAYLQTLRKQLPAHLKGVVDTGRNGSLEAHYAPRRYCLADDGTLKANLRNASYCDVAFGRWRRDDAGELWLYPVAGEPRAVKILIARDGYKEIPATETEPLSFEAPIWLDAVGDVVTGKPPGADPIDGSIEYRWIKPPDECDGSVGCPPGTSRAHVQLLLDVVQPEGPMPADEAPAEAASSDASTPH